jgi:membrane protein
MVSKKKSDRDPIGPGGGEGRRGERGVFTMIKSAVAAFFKNRSLTLAASLSYYAIFSLTPLLLIMLAVVGRLFGDTQARAAIVQRITDATGPRIGGLIDEMLRNAAEPRSGIIGMVVGFAVLFIGATGLFSQLKDALNQVWNVRPRAGGAIGKLVRTRLVGFGLVLFMGLMMIALLGASAFVSGMAERIQSTVAIPPAVVHTIDILVSMGIIATLVAVVYRYLPDARIAWKDAWVGAGITALLLALGKVGLGIYLGTSSTASVYGAAGSLAVALIWIYYTSAILLMGAEFTQCYAEMYGQRIEPAPWAERTNAAETRAAQIEPQKPWQKHFKDDGRTRQDIADEYRGKSKREMVERDGR